MAVETTESSRRSSAATALNGPQDAQHLTLPRRPWRRDVTPFDRILAQEYSGKGTEESPYLVTWLEDDPENPTSWSDTYKWFLTGLVSIATLAVALASSCYSGAVASVRAEFGGSTEVLTLGVSLFVCGFAAGPLIWAPLSEALGRRTLFIFTYCAMTLWQAVTPASPNLGALLVFRFLAGLFGSSPLSNSGGTLADIWSTEKRGLAMALFAAAPFLGPSLGPLVGGFLGITSGWRWVEGFLAIFSGVIAIVGAVLLAETYHPVLLRKRAAMLSKVTGQTYISALDSGKNTAFKHQLKVSLLRPWQLLAREPIVVVLSIYIAIIYATLYSFFSAFPLVFQTLRGWNAGVGGLAFMGVLVGMLLALVYVVLYENPRYVRKGRETGGLLPPEERLPAAMVGGPLVVIGLAWFTASAGPKVFWIVPIMAGAPFGFGMVLIFLALQNYLIDAYLLYAASVLAANSVVRSLCGAAWPLFTNYMYNPVNCPLATCGVHVGAGIATGLALLCMPAPFILYKRGASIRKKCKYAAEANAMMERMDRQMREQAELKKLGGKKASKDVGDEKEELPPVDTPAPRDEEEGSGDIGFSSYSSRSAASIEGLPESAETERISGKDAHQ